MIFAVMNAIYAIAYIEVWKVQDFSGFIAQSHRHREVTGSNPVEVLNFSDFYIRNSEIAFITAKIIAYLILSVSFLIYKSERADGLD